MTPYLTLITRDLRLSLLRGAGGMTALFFFVVTASLFPFALGAEQSVLGRAAPGILWVSAVLASLLSLETLYHRDDEDGTFDLLLLSPLPAAGVVLSKMAAHWIVSGITLVAASAILSQMLFVPAAAVPVFLAALLLGTLYMSVLGGLGAVLTFGARRPGMLLVVLILPLYIPMLILGVSAMEAALASLSAQPYLLLQLALVVAALPLAAAASAAILRAHVRT